MLTVSDLSKTFNLQTLFQKVHFSINPGDRVGLIGPNGCGKTTLLRILAGQEQPDSGRVHTTANLRIGYLSQGFELPLEATIREVVGRVVGDVEVLNKALVEAAQALAQEPDNEKIAAHYDDLLRRIQRADKSQSEAILSELGLAHIDRTSPVSILSGGQKTRLALALVLMAEPEILLLDEPTNHLDIQMLEWLEDWLFRTSCGVLIVSHDRVFLDHTINRILAFNMRSHTIDAYDGNYRAYLQQRRTTFEKKMAAYSDQQAEERRLKQDIARVKDQAAHTERQTSSVSIGGRDIKQSKDFYRRLAKKVAKKAKSREKKLDRYLDSDDRLEKPKEDRSLYFEFQETPHLGRSVMQLEDLQVGYSKDAPLLKKINLQVRSGQRIAITGPNGSGKTSLMRTIMGDLTPLKGKVSLGSSVRIGMMAQDLSTLDPEQTPVETISHAFPNQTEARHYLATYLLAGDEVLKPNGMLSFGQRARLELALLIVNGCNVLLLDEPINHLDIPSRTQFEQALDSFNGAILAVVHDRYFIQNFAQEIWMVADGAVHLRYN